MPPGANLVSVGYTTLVPGTVARWQAALPDPEAHANVQAVAVKTAAGMVTEAECGADVLDAADRGDAGASRSYNGPGRVELPSHADQRCAAGQ